MYEFAGVAAGVGTGTGVETTAWGTGAADGVTPKGEEVCASVGEAYSGGAAAAAPEDVGLLNKSRISLTALWRV